MISRDPSHHLFFYDSRQQSQQLPSSSAGVMQVSPRLPLGAGEDSTLDFDNITGVVPAWTLRKPPDTPTGASPRAAEQGPLATMAEALSAVVKGDLQKSCPCPRSSPLCPHHSLAPQSQSGLRHGATLPAAPQPVHGTKEGRSKRSLTPSPEMGTSGLCSQDCRGSTETQHSSIT